MRSRIHQRYQAWLELVDVSAALALAGLRAQGFTDAQARKRLRERWLRNSRDHLQALEKMLRHLAARERRVPQP